LQHGGLCNNELKGEKLLKSENEMDVLYYVV